MNIPNNKQLLWRKKNSNTSKASKGCWWLTR